MENDLSIKFFDETFMEIFDTNIRSLLRTMFEIDGKHPINKKKANEWILSQKTELKQKVARHLIKNTTYVTFREFYIGIGKLIKEFFHNSQTIMFLSP